jgi:hypothetical protein
MRIQDMQVQHRVRTSQDPNICFNRFSAGHILSPENRESTIVTNYRNGCATDVYVTLSLGKRVCDQKN